MTAAPVAGVCRYCSCTEENACMLAHGEPCGWIDKSRTVCNSPRCIIAEENRRKAARPRSRFAGMGFGLIVETLRREERRRRRKGKAA